MSDNEGIGHAVKTTVGGADNFAGVITPSIAERFDVPRLAMCFGAGVVQEIPLRGAPDHKSIVWAKSELPLRPLANFLYASGFTHAGRLLDDSLVFILRGKSTADPVAPGPPSVAIASRRAATVGFLDSNATDSVALRRFSVGVRVFGSSGLLGLLYSPIAMLFGLVALFAYVYCVGPIWGVKLFFKPLPDSARTGFLQWHKNAGAGARVIGYFILYFIGMVSAVIGVTLLFFVAFWPPALLRMMSATGDAAIATRHGTVLYSAWQNTVIFLPHTTLLHRGRLSTYYALLADERRSGKPVACTLCVAKLPAQWVEKRGLPVRKKEWRSWKQLVQASRR